MSTVVAPTRARRRVLLALGAMVLILPLTACTVGAPSGSPDAAPTGDQAPHEGPMRIAMITHGDDGGFWSIVRRGAQDAAATLPAVTLDYQGSAGDAKLQSDMISAAITQGADALAVSAPDVGAISSSLSKAQSAGIPVITLNSGSELLGSMDNVITHVGQSEASAGREAGEKLAELSAAKVLCILHEENNIGLQERCQGAKDGLGSAGQVVNVQVTGSADPASTALEIGAAMDAQQPDAVLALDPDIATAAQSQVTSRQGLLATFDVSPDVLDAITAGDIAFAVDQQPYLQGYLPVTFLELAVRNRNEVGAGQMVATGPALVTKDNAAAIAALAREGTR